MIKTIGIEFWIIPESGSGRCKYLFEMGVRQDMWDSLSEAGREQFILEQIGKKMEIRYRVVDKENS